MRGESRPRWAIVVLMMEGSGRMKNHEQSAEEQQMRFDEGAVILGGRYRIARLLYQRPRLNLYLARRIVPVYEKTPALAIDASEGSLVAIRELLCNDLSPLLRAQIETALFEEFTTPVALGSPHLPEMGNRSYSEGDRYYYVMQLQHDSNGAGKIAQTRAVTLEALLLEQPDWPTWLDSATALRWTIQLCRMVARLHRLGVVLGELSPATILVDADHIAPWLPLLLPSWPPAPCFWSLAQTALTPQYVYQQVFPFASLTADNPFVAPESMHGIADERADVYAVGAILYLLLTHYAPIAAERRLYKGLGRDVLSSWGSWGSGQRQSSSISSLTTTELASSAYAESLPLIAPRLLCRSLPQKIEQMVVRALALSPSARFASVFVMVEILEAIEHTIAR